jgi:hypothetical protein
MQKNIKDKNYQPARFGAAGAALTGDLGGDNLAASIIHFGSVLFFSTGKAMFLPPGGLTTLSSFCINKFD